MAEKITRARITETAFHILESEGFEALTLKHLAKSLGIRTPSLYNHIKNAQDLHESLAISGWQRLAEQLTHVSLLEAAAVVYRRFVREQTALYMLMSQHTQKAVPLLNQLRVFMPPGPEKDIVHATYSTWSLLHGFMVLEQQNEARPETFNYLLRTLRTLNGLKS